HLSGGMDSSSIVCMAEAIIASGSSGTPRLDTISWYDDFNPGLDERPYFTKVEEKRGRAGFHINPRALGQLDERETHSEARPLSAFQRDKFHSTPYFINSDFEFFKLYSVCIASQGYRVVLSGIAGDDVMGGGVPTPRAELQDLLARARLFKLAHQAKA